MAVAVCSIFSCTPKKTEKKEASVHQDLPWEELRAKFECPAWYTEGKLGIWTHWGPQSQPEKGGGWYARHMYMQDIGRETWGKNAYTYHVETYGHPSEIGYKDVLNEWKADKLDTDALMKYFKSLGAKFFVGMANHHDHFDNFDSSHQPWNSVNVGPKRDIVGEFAKSAKKYGLPFGVSSHDDRHLSWWKTAFGADKHGPKKGIPYDGHMTKEDGKGKWWEGLDPADLYGLPPEKRTPEWIKKNSENWMQRHLELVRKYDLDMLWFDGYLYPYGEYGRKVCEEFYNKSLRENGKIDGLIAGKFGGISKEDQKAFVLDFERGYTSEILRRPWQSITTLNGWFHKNERADRLNARVLIENFSDILSKNGVLLLNVELLGDGSFPEEHRKEFDDFGAWVNLNAPAIYKSKAWKVLGDNLDSDKAGLFAADETDLEQANKKAHNFNERDLNSPPYGKDEVRFTVRDNKLYVFVLNPETGTIRLPKLGLDSRFKPGKVSSVRMLGGTAVNFEQTDDYLQLSVPAERPNEYTAVFELEGAV
ncbi:alpha-L-fucosidase [Fulvitalea axinellae]|uniref:alpha-L-fucosidase n=2 Tax=Fulvitalea axinellae TaxID=1182444 RepID=A0AAU9D7E1_9BACT|nr:alpha-L-fucosidase [Fulvitalea axinellae]